MINIGIIGFGVKAQNSHLKQMRDTGRFHVKAAADIYDGDALAKSYGIDNYYRDYRKLLEDPEIDAVLVASPHDLHEEQCVAAFEAGKHVLVEKPIARNLTEAKHILAAAEKSGKVGMVGLNERFRGPNQYIKETLDRNELGTLLSARIDHYQNFNPAPNSWWRSAEKSGGGAVIGSGIHRLDLLRWFLGEPVSVYAKAQYMPERLEAEACVHSVIEFDSGAVANFSINWACYNYWYYEAVSVCGKNGLMYYDIRTDGETLKKSRRDIDGGRLKDVVPDKTYPTMYEHFADCIEGGTTPITSLDEGYKTLKLVRAIYRSMETGSAVDPEDVEN